MLAKGLGHAVHQLKATFSIEIRIAAVYAHREDIRNFQVGLSADRGKIEKAVSILHASFVHQGAGEYRNQVSY